MSDSSLPHRQPLPPGQFSLGGIFLLMTLIASCLAVVRLVPCLGIPLVIIFVPAMIRTFINVRYYGRLGERMTIREKAEDFLLSACIILWSQVMAFITGGVVATGIAIPLGIWIGMDAATVPAILLGATISLALFSGLMWRFRPGVP